MINERMKQLINAVSNGNKRAFSQLVGVTPTVIENIVGTRQGKPGYELLEKIAFSIENINLDWLFTGRGTMFSDSTDQQVISPISTSSDAIVLRLMEKLDEKDDQITHLQSELRTMEKNLGNLKAQLAHYQPENKIDQLEAGDLGGKTHAKNASTKKHSSHDADNAKSAIVP